MADHKMLKDKWSPDACVGYAKENRLFPSTEIPSTKSLYRWINKSLEEVSKEIIYRINEWMNNLSRKLFNYKTAKEEFIKEIKQLKSI